MSSIRVIPCLDIRDGRVVKGTNFVQLRDSGDPVERAKFYNDEGADELVFLDITASHERRATVIDLAERVGDEVFIPFTVGGGMNSVGSIREALAAGADKVSVNSAALADPNLIELAANEFGAQCIVTAIDARRNGDHWEVLSHGGRNRTGRDAVEWAKEATDRGSGEILLTSMDGDGTLSGYDIALTQAIARSVSVPVIASGGAGEPSHLVQAVREGGADAVLVASIVHDQTYRIRDLKQALLDAGLPVRWV